tara:strand:+ start:1304 stop:1624 length:321 start_codon:yes stop_codon:yes gene_type:complete
VVAEFVPARASLAAVGVGKAALRGLPAASQHELVLLRRQFVAGLTRDMQNNVHELVDLRTVMVGGFVRERQLLIDLFQRCGKSLTFHFFYMSHPIFPNYHRILLSI